MTSVVDPTVLAATAKPTEDDKQLAFLPNLLPSYKTDESVGMFSLFHDAPHVNQGWRIMLRGLHLPKLLVDQKTIEFLEACAKHGGVDWKPLPPSDNSGTVGVVFPVATFEDADTLSEALESLNLEEKEDTTGEDGDSERSTDPERASDSE